MIIRVKYLMQTLSPTQTVRRILILDEAIH